MNRHDFMLLVTVTLTFELLTPKLIGIIFRLWPSMMQRKVYQGEISLMSEQDLANAGQMDGRHAP